MHHAIIPGNYHEGGVCARRYIEQTNMLTPIFFVQPCLLQAFISTSEQFKVFLPPARSSLEIKTPPFMTFSGVSVTHLEDRHTKESKQWRVYIFSARCFGSTCSVHQCGVDLVDTKRRANEPGPAEDYLRYFTEHFTDTEWETIKRQVLKSAIPDKFAVSFVSVCLQS